MDRIHVSGSPSYVHTGASMLHVHLNAPELQRLGQHRPVLITRLVVEDSIESRIIQLQEKKSAMVDGEY